MDAFAVCALPVFVWAIISYLYAFPSYFLRLTVWDLIGTASYTLAFALIESIVVMLPFLVLAVILPPRFFRARFVSLTSIIVVITSAWMMYNNYHQLNLADWTSTQSLSSFLVYVFTLVVPIAIVVCIKRVENFLCSLVRRLSVLVYVYTSLALLGVLVVVLRNI